MKCDSHGPQKQKYANFDNFYTFLVVIEIIRKQLNGLPKHLVLTLSIQRSPS